MFAQVSLETYSDLGHSNVSEGVFLKTSANLSYNFKQSGINAGIQNEIISNNKSFFSGFSLNFFHNFNIKQKAHKIKAFAMTYNLSDFVIERNYGVLFSNDNQRFIYKLGTGFKSIGFTKNALENFGINSNKQVFEIFNPLYSFSYFLYKPDNKWNVGICITNLDYFAINQATNPMTNVKGYYKINESVRLFAEFCYKTSGAFNLHVNYYGLNFRPGIIWEIK